MYAAVVTTAWFSSGARCDSVPAGGVERALAMVGDLLHPDLSGETLRLGVELSLQTLAVALWGTALGAAAGLSLALVASRNIAVANRRKPPVLTRLAVASSRLVLDVVRAVPDFAWALAVLMFTGAGALTGVIAIAISVTGLLGKTYSQLLDTVPEDAVAPVHTSGANRLMAALWGYVPSVGGSMLSYTLLRLECSVRNASVIGVVGGGGLGAALFEELGFGRYDRVATFVGFLLLLTSFADRASKHTLSLTRPGARSRRTRAVAMLALSLIVGAVALLPAARAGLGELGRLDATFFGNTARGLLAIESATSTVADLVSASLVPLGIAIASTAAATGVALGLVFVFPLRRPPPTAPGLVRHAHLAARVVLDAVALLTRAVPDVVWLLLLSVALGMGPLAAVAAIGTHSFGLLARLFTEVIDDVPAATIEARRLGSDQTTFAWGVWPEVAPRIGTHVALQTESNLRAGLIVGIVGVGGLGDGFADSLAFWRLGDVTLHAFAMVVLTVVVDRVARRLTRAPHRPHATTA